MIKVITAKLINSHHTYKIARVSKKFVSTFTLSEFISAVVYRPDINPVLLITYIHEINNITSKCTNVKLQGLAVKCNTT